MSEGMNRVTLFGNLGQDPELKVTQGGQAVLKMRIATTESYLDKNNTRQERTEWHSVTMWGKRGEALAKFLKKGDRLLVEGSLRTTSYEKNGEKRYSTEVNATNVILGGKSKGDAAGDSAPTARRERSPYDTSGHSASAKHTGTPEPAGSDDFADAGDDSIPFAVPFDVAPRHIHRRNRWERF